MTAYPKQGKLFRTWRRRVKGMTQEQVAAALGTTKGVISSWETAGRGLSFEDVDNLDDCFEARGALSDVAAAMGTPSGLPPRRTWVHNPQGGNGPVWAWCRLQPGRRRIAVQVRWGAFTFSCLSDCTDDGIFVTSPVSMPNPPAWVDLPASGWVDFGRGEIPPELGIPTFDPLSGMRLGTGGHSPAGLVAAELVKRFNADPTFAQAVLEWFGQRPDVVQEVFSTTDARTGLSDLTHRPRPASDGAPSAPFTGAQYRRLRQARCFSLERVARKVTTLLPSYPVTDDQLRALELGGNPRPKYLRSRVDQVLRADGYTCRESATVTPNRSPFVIEFPSYWIGPVWVTFAAGNDGAAARVRLEFGDHIKELAVRSGMTVTCRRSVPEKEPLAVFCPRGWQVTAGMGRHPHAYDVNWGWRDRYDRQGRGDDPVHDLFLWLFGKTTEEFEAFLRRFDGEST